MSALIFIPLTFAARLSMASFKSFNLTLAKYVKQLLSSVALLAANKEAISRSVGNGHNSDPSICIVS
eukprot:00108.XXX_1034_1234_1 [CDS] Oithona nana genome sequencing.